MSKIIIGKTYEDGINDAWTLAERITSENEKDLPARDLKKIFPSCTCGSEFYHEDVFQNYTYKEALDKIEKFMEDKKLPDNTVKVKSAKKIKLGPCPFCRTKNARLVYDNAITRELCQMETEEELDKNDIYAFIHCDECGIDFLPDGIENTRDLITIWNNATQFKE